MALSVSILVLGFSDVERHSLNTLFRLSRTNGPNYVLWTPEDAASPNVALIDVDSYEGGLYLVSPSFNPNLRMICVGHNAPAHAWRVVQRPVDWAAMVLVLDALFVLAHDRPLANLEVVHARLPPTPPGLRCALFVGMPQENAYFLRARLALAGVLVVDEVHTLEQCEQQLGQRAYDVGLAYVEPSARDPWAYVRYFQGLQEPLRNIVAVMYQPDWRAFRLSEQLGCTALLEVPFNPQQVSSVFQRI